MTRSLDVSREVGHRTVTDASVMTFGCLTGDYAQMHFDHGFGPDSGMGGTIAHGLLSASWSLGALTLYASERLSVGDPEAWLAGYRIKFSRMVYLGDRFTLRWSEGSDPAVEGLEGLETLDTDFEILNQRGEVTCSGAVSVGGAAGVCGASTDSRATALPAPPDPLLVEPWCADSIESPLFADELVERGPRGESVGRTVTEADVVAYANFTGELNPAYLNDEFASKGRFGARIAPPMWTFCVGFGDYLRELLAIPMPSSGFAGHLGDQWRLLAPIHVGDTLRTRHKPLSFTPSRSRPDKGIVEFGLQMLNQRDEVVQDGRVAMMMNARA